MTSAKTSDLIKKSIGVIKMEVIRNHEPQTNFLQKSENWPRNGIVLIFDECTSGFRNA